MARPVSPKSEKIQAGVQSVENGLDLVLILAHHRRPMKLTAVAEQAGISPGKAHRYLVSFMRAGFVAQDPETGLYGMGPVALEFSLSCLATIEPISIATREAQKLCGQTGHTVAVCVWGSFGPTVVRWEQSANPVMINVGLGSVYPLYRSATGRIFAAFLPPEIVRLHAAKVRQDDSVGADPVETIEEVRQRGMAVSHGSHFPGMRSFAAPVFDDCGRLVLSLTVLGHQENFDNRVDGPVAAALREAAARCSKQLGYDSQHVAPRAAE